MTRRRPHRRPRHRAPVLRPRARRGLLLLALLAAPALAPIVTPGHGGATAQAAPAPRVQVDEDDDGPLTVEVERLDPRAPTTAEEPFVVSGTIVNTGDEPVTDLEVRVLVGRVVTSRSLLARADEQRLPGSPRGAASTPALTELAAGASTPFELRLVVGDLRLDRIGVYPVAVEVRGRLDGGRSVSPLGRASTFLPWFPDGPPQRTRIAWLWPLVDLPRQTPDGALVDDELSGSLAGDPERSGRLGRLLSAARGAPQVPVTYAVDPALLDAVATMTAPYRIRTTGDDTREQAASETATAWLAALRDALAEPAGDGPPRPPKGLLALPYADPDVLALTRTTTGLTDDIELLRRLGQRVAEQVTGREPDSDVVWPPGPQLTPAALDAALAAGTSAVVLDEAAFEPLRFDTNRTPSTAMELASASAGEVTGLVVEQDLSRLLQASPRDEGWQGSRLAEQRFLAETAIIAAERPGEARTLLVAPDRRGDVVPDVASAALQDSTRLPWLCAVGLDAVASGTAVCPTPIPGAPPEEPSEREERGSLQPPEPPPSGLSLEHLDEVAELRALTDQLTDQVLDPSSESAVETKARLLEARGRTESAAWRDRPRSGRMMLELLDDEVADLRSRVSLQTSGRVALSGDTGTITVSILNALDQPVTVGVDLNDPVEARLTTESTELQEVRPSSSLQVPIRVSTRTSGQFVVRATLLDRSGTPFGEPVELVVRSTGYSRAALAVTGVGVAVLLVAAGVRITRRALRSPRPAGPDDDESA